MKWQYHTPCDHCGGTIILSIESEHLSYTCERCGCRWAWGMILIHKGARCPVHGTYAENVAELAGDELRAFDDPNYVPFQEVTNDKRT